MKNLKFISLIFVLFTLAACGTQIQEATQSVVDTATDAVDVVSETVVDAVDVVVETTEEMADKVVETTETVVEEGKDMMDDAMSDDDESEEMADKEVEVEVVETATAGSYSMYDSSLVDTDDTVILSFSAAWCPSCVALKDDVKASLDDIPAGVTILEVDYDNSDELKEKYNVTGQHTFVVVDEQGNELDKWRGGNTLEDVLTRAGV